MGLLRDNDMVRSIMSQETQEVFADGADAALDALTDSGALEEIPVFGALLKLVRASQGIREQFLFNKLAHFLEEASKLSEADKFRFAEKLEDPEEADRFGASLLILIEKAEDLSEPRIYGRLLIACARGHFEVTDLTRLCKMVNRALIEDFIYLKNMHYGIRHFANRDIEQSLYTAGFLRLKGLDAGTIDDIGSDKVDYDLTTYGKWLVEFGLTEKPIPDPIPTISLF